MKILTSLLLSAILALAGCKQERAEPTTAKPPAPAAPSNSLPKIVAFGDSLTAGYGLPLSESYPALLQKKLEADGYAYEVVNAGVSGDTTDGGVRRIDWALEGDVKFVILELGANDILRGQPVSKMKTNLAQIIERARARWARVLLACM
jgi:acyl-CoA thioesterase-1